MDVAVAIEVGLHWGSCWGGGGRRGLFRTFIPGSAGDAAAAFHVDATPWKSGCFRAGLEAAPGLGGSQSWDKGQQLNTGLGRMEQST